MPTLKVSELLQATGGTLLSGDPSLSVSSYAIDTRKLAAGGAFFALAVTVAEA